ncbi:MAG: hypothetical protein JNL10_12565 [Verrucomicrobiales bacterium]|nr:hypothetical protein [Verrucomicrobiales bacterium]
MSKVWRGMGFGTLAIVLTAALGLVWEHHRGRQQLEETVARLKASGAYPDPAVLFAPPGPSNGFRSFERAVSGLSFCPGPDSMMGIAPGRAAPCFIKSQWLSADGRTNTWDSLAAWRQDFAADFDSLHSALAQPDCRMPIDWRPGYNIPLPPLILYKQGAQALAATALLAARNGDKAEALQQLKDLQRLVAALASERRLDSQVTRMASASIGLHAAWDIAQREDWTEADLAALQASLPSADICPSFVESIRGENALWVITMLDPNFSPTFPFGDLSGWLQRPLQPVTGPEDLVNLVHDLLQRTRFRLQMALFDPLFRFGWRDQACAVYLEVMNQLERRCRSACVSHNLKSFSSSGVFPDRTLGWYDGLRFNLSIMAVQSSCLGFSKVFALEAERTLTETQIALRRYTLLHGEAPVRLEQLVPEFLPTIPLDSMVGEPLRFRRNPDGSTTLWSVGEDFEDDGGAAGVPEPPIGFIRTWEGLDMVVPNAVGQLEFHARIAEVQDRWEMEHVVDAPQARRYWPLTTESAATNTAFTIGGASEMDPALVRRYGLIPKDPAATNGPAPK